SSLTKTVSDQPRNPWILVGAVGGAVVVLILAVLMTRKPAPAVEEPPPPPPRVGIKPAPPKVDSAAAAALQKAALYEKENPHDLDGQIREYSDLTLLADRGEAGAEAKRKVEALRARDGEAVRLALEA